MSSRGDSKLASVVVTEVYLLIIFEIITIANTIKDVIKIGKNTILVERPSSHS